MTFMSQICFYFDEDAGKRSLIDSLRQSQVDVLTTVETNNLQQTDEEQLIWATQHKRVIYTFNMGDFCRLHKSYMIAERTHAGIIVVAKQRYSVGDQLQAIHNIINAYSAEQIVDQLVFLGNGDLVGESVSLFRYPPRSLPLPDPQK